MTTRAAKDTDDQEKHDLEGRFYVKFEESEYGWIDVELGKEKPERYSNRETIKFTVHKNKDGAGRLGSVYIDGYNIEKTLRFGYLTSVEALLINAHYNKTPIIIDVDDEDDIDNSFDIDY